MFTRGYILGWRRFAVVFLTTRSGFGHRRGLILKKDGMIMVRKIWHGSPIVLLTTIMITMVIWY